MGFGLFPIHEMENHKDMFETTNQITIIFPLWLVYTLLTTINITMFQTTNHQPPTSIVCGKRPPFLDHFWNATGFSMSTCPRPCRVRFALEELQNSQRGILLRIHLVSRGFTWEVRCPRSWNVNVIVFFESSNHMGDNINTNMMFIIWKI